MAGFALQRQSHGQRRDGRFLAAQVQFPKQLLWVEEPKGKASLGAAEAHAHHPQAGSLFRVAPQSLAVTANEQLVSLKWDARLPAPKKPQMEPASQNTHVLGLKSMNVNAQG